VGGEGEHVADTVKGEEIGHRWCAQHGPTVCAGARSEGSSCGPAVRRAGGVRGAMSLIFGPSESARALRFVAA
jgi:hypothetical protein